MLRICSVPSLLQAALGILLCLPYARHLAATEFLHTQGDHSLNSIFGIPAPLVSSLHRGQGQLLISGTYANQFAGGTEVDEFLLLDGERTELRIAGYKALQSCWDWGVEVPLIMHGSGYFDRAIESWHELFGLPNGNRDEVEPNLLSLVYEDPSGQTLTMNSSSASIGDMHLQFIRPTNCSGANRVLGRVETRVGVKLPTGDTVLLSGSGGTDVYADITSGDLARSRALGLRASLGLLVLGDSDVVSNEKSWAVYGSSVLGWRYSSTLELLAQLDWHSALFDSKLRELGALTTQLAFGGRWRFSGGSVFDLAIQEDVSPDTAPDITLFAGYRRGF